MFERGQQQGEESIDFNWQGIDGSILPAHWEKDTYFGLNLGLAWQRSRSYEWIAERIENEVIKQLISLEDDVMLTKIGGDFLLPRQEHIEFINWWNKAYPAMCIELAHPGEYLKLISERTLKTVSGDLNPLMQGAYSTRIILKQLNRLAENLIYAYEAAIAVTGVADAAQPAGNATELWRRLCTLQFHDIICGSLADEAWKEALADYLKLVDDLRHLLGCLQGQANDGISAADVLLFNPLPYARTEVIRIAGQMKRVRLESMQILPATEADAEAPSAGAAVNGNIISNGLITAEVDKFGRLKHMIDLENDQVYTDERYGCLHDIAMEPDFGDPWMPGIGPVNCSLLYCQPLHDAKPPSGVEIIRQGPRDARAADLQCFNLPAISSSVDRQGLHAEIIVKYEDAGLAVRYALQAGEKLLRIDVRHNLCSVQRRIRAVVPTGIVNGNIRREIPAGWIVQEQGEYPAQNWMDYADGAKGLCILNKGLPGNNVTDGIMMLTLFRSVAMIEPDTRPDYETGVERTAEYALYPFSPNDNKYDPVRLGRLFNQDILLLEKKRWGDGSGPAFTVDEGIEFMAVRRNADDCSMEIRMYETRGKREKHVVRSSVPLAKVTKIKPTGEQPEVMAMHVDYMGWDIQVDPFEIVTVTVVKTPYKPSS